MCHEKTIKKGTAEKFSHTLSDYLLKAIKEEKKKFIQSHGGKRNIHSSAECKEEVFEG